MMIMTPRNIPESLEAYDKIDYVDKVHLKGYTEKEVLKEMMKFFEEHKEYTHLILTGDDIIPPYNSVANLMADLEAHPEIEVLSAVIGMDKFADANLLSATIEPVTDREPDLTIDYLSYKRLPYEFTNVEGIIPVWYQGFAFTFISRKIMETIGLRTWLNGNSECASDLKFAFDLAKANIPQYVDLRVFIWHLKHEYSKNSQYEVMNMRNSKRNIRKNIFIPAKGPIPSCKPVKVLSYKDIPNEMDIYNLTYNKYNKLLKICFVAEFNQKIYHQWYKAFDSFFQSHNFVDLYAIEINPYNIETKPAEYFDPIKEADIVYCYISPMNIRDMKHDIWKWWEELPKRCKGMMKLGAKLIVQYDDEMQFVEDIERRSWNRGWENDKEYLDRKSVV